jgi:tRNA1(Val) A37 N6-methylase TrmN6
VAAEFRRLKPGGWLTMIQNADRLADLLAAMTDSGGSIAVLPIAPRTGRPAGRVIVTARKGGRGPLRLLAPMLVHARAAHGADVEDLTDAAQAVLRCGEGLRLTP